MDIDQMPEVPSNPTCEEGEIEVGEVRETLDEIFTKADLSSSKANPLKAAC